MADKNQVAPKETLEQAPQDAPEGEVKAEETQGTPTDEKPTEDAPEAPEGEVKEEEPSSAEVAQELDVRKEYKLPESWSDEHVAQWFENADTSVDTQTENGVYRYDPTRQNKPVGDWSTDELAAQLKGELQGIPERMNNSVLREYRQRTDVIPTAWTTAQAVEFMKSGKEPEMTASGVWKQDVTRVSRQVEDWSNDELNAWARKEIRAEGKATDLKLANELRQRFDLQVKGDSVEAVLEAYKNRQPAKEEVKPTEPQVKKAEHGALTSMNLSFIESNLQRYADTVTPRKPITEATGGAAQQNLERLFSYVLQLDSKAMVEGLDEIKGFINKHRDGVFSPSNAHRFTHMLKGDHRLQQRHVNLIELFMIVTSKNQAQRKQTDIRVMLADQPADKIDVLVDYFTNYA